MKKTAVIHQPDFLSYIGFFDRLLNVDMFVILDNAQFVQNTSKSWMNRDKIKTPNGEKWITVAVQKSPTGIKINEVLLSKNKDWKEKNIHLIVENYKKAPYFSEIMPYVEELYQFECERLIEFNLKSIYMLLDLFDIHIETFFASALDPQGKKNDLLVDILQKIGATRYISGPGARDYLDPATFDKAGIEVIWQDFKHPVYPQIFGEFIPYLSSIDLFFNCGIDKSRKILRKDI